MAKVTKDQEAWDDIREFMGLCPLYQGVIAERDNEKPVPIQFMRNMNQRNHKCQYCNVNREGKHQDYCPAHLLTNENKPKRNEALLRGNPQKNRERFPFAATGEG